ncbi:MAG: hypothetical protein ACPG4T_05475 [Nannocystaceae bacterium]
MSDDHDDDDVLLPPAEQQTQLVQQLASLVSNCGYEPLVLAPLLEPTATFFPDRWAGGEASMRRVCQRLLHYAGLGDYRVEVAIHEDKPSAPPAEGKPNPLTGEDIHVWLISIRDGVCRIGVEATAMREPLGLVAATSRAIADAFLVAKGRAPNQRGAREQMIDIASIYLGFGILTTEASMRHVSGADGNFRSRPRKSKLGVLGPVAMSYLLAIQARARGLDRKGHRRITKYLRANQAAFYRRGLVAIDRDIGSRLGIPDEDAWPDLPSIRSLIPNFETHEEEVTAPEEAVGLDRGVVGMNDGRAIFRVERSASLRVAKLLALPVVMLGGVVARGFQGIEIQMHYVIALGAGLGLIGLILGRMLKDRRCSEPKCGQALTPEMESCPRCGGIVRGVIRHPRERLAAEEALRDADTQADEADVATDNEA